MTHLIKSIHILRIKYVYNYNIIPFFRPSLPSAAASLKINERVVYLLMKGECEEMR